MPRGRITASHADRDRRTHDLLRALSTSTRSVERQLLTEEIAEINLPLCEALANRFAGRGSDRDDLVQVARVGLLLAIQRYRIDDGTTFAGFAVPTMAGELKRHFRDHCWTVRPPRRIQELRPQVVASRTALTQQLGRVPTLAEVALHLGEASSTVATCLAAAEGFQPLSLDATAHPDGTARLIDTLTSGDDDVDWLIGRLTLARAVNTLSAQGRLLVRLRFVDALSQTQIAERLGVSQMQVSRLLRRTLRQLRDRLTETGLTAA